MSKYLLQITWILLLSLLLQKLQAQDYFSYNQLYQECYQHILELEFNKANEILSKARKEEPNNLASIHLENYIDFYQLFIGEDQNLYSVREKAKSDRLSIIKKNGSASDPYTKFVQAEIILQWALVRLKFKENLKAATELYTAYQLLKENQSSFPDFTLNNKSLAILHSLFGTLPINETVKSWIGIDGSIDQGISEINRLIQSPALEGSFFKLEGLAIAAYILCYQKNEAKQALELIQNSVLYQGNSQVSHFLVCKIAQRAGYNDFIIDRLENYIKAKDTVKLSILYLQLGFTKLYKLEKDADLYIHKFLDQFEGKMYIKEAYQKLAWHAWVVNNDAAAYSSYMLSCIEEGDELSDDDKQALAEAKENKIPDKTLLKARLLFDGSYYDRAYKLLVTQSENYYNDGEVPIEYTYRMARITHKLNNLKEALINYEFIIDKMKEPKSYLTCNAALQAGIIYEHQHNWVNASKCYKKCLDLKPDRYRLSLHQKAKSGLKRLAHR